MCLLLAKPWGERFYKKKENKIKNKEFPIMRSLNPS